VRATFTITVIKHIGQISNISQLRVKVLV